MVVLWKYGRMFVCVGNIYILKVPEVMSYHMNNLLSRMLGQKVICRVLIKLWVGLRLLHKTFENRWCSRMNGLHIKVLNI